MQHRILIGIIASILLCAIIASDIVHAIRVHRNLAHRAAPRRENTNTPAPPTPKTPRTVTSRLENIPWDKKTTGDTSRTVVSARAQAVGRSRALSWRELMTGESLSFGQRPHHSDGRSHLSFDPRREDVVRLGKSRKDDSPSPVSSTNVLPLSEPPMPVQDAQVPLPLEVRSQESTTRMMRAELHYRLKSMPYSTHTFRNLVWRVSRNNDTASHADGEPRQGMYRVPDVVVTGGGVFLIAVRPVEGNIQGRILDDEWMVNLDTADAHDAANAMIVTNPLPALRDAAQSMADLLAIPADRFHTAVIIPVTRGVSLEADEGILTPPSVDVLMPTHVIEWMTSDYGTALSEAQMTAVCAFLTRAQTAG